MANYNTPPNALKLAGKRFGKLTAIRRAGRTERGNALWLCQCDCGGTTIANATSLRRGEIVSCGCNKREQIDNARKVLMSDKTVDGVAVPLLTKKTRSDSSTGVKGVRRRVRRGRVYYEPYISIKGKRIFGKSSASLEEAAKERKRLEEVYHKPYIKKMEDHNGQK